MVQIMYAPREQRDATEYSEILGYATEDGISKGTSRGPGSLSRSENISDQKRALMLPQELREMGSERIIVMSDDCKPVIADKIFYYRDPAFKDRLLAPVAVASIDVDAFIAQREGRTKVGKADKPLSASVMPTITNREDPIPSEIAALADHFFASVQWTRPPADAAPTNPETETEPVNGLEIGEPA